MGEDLSGSQSSAGVHVQHLGHNVLGQTGDGQPVARVHVVLSFANSLENVLW